MPPRPRHLILLRPLTVDMAAIEAAFDPSSPEDSHYLDVETGEVVALGPGDVARALRADPEDLAGPDAERIETARTVLRHIGKRFRPIPGDDPADVWADADGFADAQTDAKLKRKMRDALRKPAPLRRFFRIVWDAGVADRWALHASEARRERIVDWLASLGIGPSWVETDD